jgi:hypothetical protein
VDHATHYSRRVSVTSVQASLSIYGQSTKLTAAAVTEALEVEPTQSHELGDPHFSPSMAALGKVTTTSYWSFREERTIADDEDPHGINSLVRLAERFEGKAEALAKLRARGYSIVVWMFGSSDSGQAGFAVGPETMRRLGAMSAAFKPDIYLGEYYTAEEIEDWGQRA